VQYFDGESHTDNSPAMDWLDSIRNFVSYERIEVAIHGEQDGFFSTDYYGCDVPCGSFLFWKLLAQSPCQQPSY